MDDGSLAKATCRNRILAAATELFVAEGYACSIAEIATRAGVARQTLYNHFPSKEALFECAIRSRSRSAVLPLAGRHRDIREALVDFGIVWRRAALSADEIGLQRALISEARQFFELGRTYMDEGIGRVIKDLSEFLERVDASRNRGGRDYGFAAEVLVGMLSGFDDVRCLLGRRNAPNDDKVTVPKMVDTFLRWYGDEATVEAGIDVAKC